MTSMLDIPSRLLSSVGGAASRDNGHAAPGAACADDGLAAFLDVRAHLYGIACRMLGNAVEAEDIVQDVWVRWQTADRCQVRDATAFLTTTAKRLAINVMRSARARREKAVDAWLPEPVDKNANPADAVERSQALSTGILVLLEKLSTAERAAFILREAFDYPYRDIAHVLRLEEANARQVVTRARRHVAEGRRMHANADEQGRLVEVLDAAAHSGEVAGLEGFLASTVVSNSNRDRGVMLTRVTARLGIRSITLRRARRRLRKHRQPRLEGTIMNSTAALPVSPPPGDARQGPQDALVQPLFSKELAGTSDRELAMIVVEYPPGGVDPVHRHNAQAVVYVLEGSIVMQVRGADPVTLLPGQTFYEGPDDVHIVGRNASDTAPARFLVFLVKGNGAPLLTVTA